MDTSTLRAPEPSPATRAQYERAALTLALAWPALVRRHRQLRPDDFVILAFLLAQRPGLVMHQGKRVKRRGRKPGIAEQLGWQRCRVWRALKRLRDAFLVVAVTYKPKARLPFGDRNYAKTYVCRYFVNLAAIGDAAHPPPLEDEPSSGSDSEPSTGFTESARDPSPPTPSRATHRRRSHAPAAHRVESETPSSAHDAAGESAQESPPTSEGEREHRRDEEQGEGQAVAALVAAWDALRVPEAGGTVSACRPSERAAIRNRLREVGQLRVMLAIAGAGASSWLRGGRARSAIAVVFGSRETVERFAADGEQLAATAERQRAQLAERQAQEAAEARAWRDRRVDPEVQAAAAQWAARKGDES